jgi:hypothetical protein
MALYGIAQCDVGGLSIDLVLQAHAGHRRRVAAAEQQLDRSVLIRVAIHHEM